MLGVYALTTDSIGAMTQLILASVSDHKYNADGKAVAVVDSEMLFYRLFDVDSENFAAFIFEIKNCILWADTISDHVTAYVAETLKSEMHAIVRNYLVSVTGKSGEKGKLIRQLLQDKSESVITFHGKDKGMMDKMRNSQGNNDQQQGGQQ